jgi:hypothetical protein
MLLSSPASVARADADVIAPALLDDAIVDDAARALDDLVASLSPEEAHALEGVYVALERSRVDVVAMPACDDDGDYVIVISRGLLELVENVAYADASDRVRGSHLLAEYGALLARSQRADVAPLPVPAAASPAVGAPRDPVGQVARAFARDALAWLVADELAHAVARRFTCPAPTLTREQGDDVWSDDEQRSALGLAPLRMTPLSSADAWATRSVLSRGGSEVPAVEVLEVMGALEDARSANAYVTLHPHSRARAAAVHGSAEGLRAESPPARRGMR